MFWKRFKEVLRAVVLVVLLCAVPVASRADYTATVSPGTVLVTNFQGWGTSLCWWANVVGGYTNRNTYVNLAFNQLKLNVVRYNIGGGENPAYNFLAYRARMQGFEPSNGVWNWNADLNQRWVLQYALTNGANLVDAFANSPPYWMTVSGSVTGAVGSTNNLLVADQNLFAQYLANVVSNLTILDGVHFDYVTPMNEPVGSKWPYGNSQEGCNMNETQQVPVVEDLRAALNVSLPSAGIDAAEDVDPYQTYSSISAYPPAAQNDLALCTTHTYSETGNTSFASEANTTLAKPSWVAEYGDNDGTGLTMAQRIHDDITVMGVRAWCYWQFVDSASGWGFLLNTLTTNASGTNTSYTINEKYYAMGQFSEFIRPGAKIISVNDNYTLAAYTPSNSTLVLVLVNTNTSGFNVTYNLNSFGAVPWQVAVIQTAAGKNLVTNQPLLVTGNQLTSAIPASSITTFFLSTNATPPTILNASPAPPDNAIQLTPGESCSLSVVVAGSGPLSYQWLSNGVPINGATAASYTSPPSLASNSVTSYDCVITNASGSATSIVWTVTVAAAPAASYPQAVLALNPAGYWPMHEMETAAAGDIETNYGSLGSFGQCVLSRLAGEQQLPDPQGCWRHHS